MPTAETMSTKYLELYRQSKELIWDPALIDLTQDAADWEMIRREHAGERFPEQIHRLCSLFWEGEGSVATTLAPFLGAIGRAGLGVDKEMFLASQLYEEARHFEFFTRYFREVLGDEDTSPHLLPEPRAVLVDDLAAAADRIRRAETPEQIAEALVTGVTHYMGVVEAMLARTGYRGAAEALERRGWLPGLQEGFRLIRRDEGRHVAFGMTFVREMVEREPRHAALVRETFDRQLPNVLATVQLFDYPVPLTPVEPLVTYAMEACAQFQEAAGLQDP